MVGDNQKDDFRESAEPRAKNLRVSVAHRVRSAAGWLWRQVYIVDESLPDFGIQDKFIGGARVGIFSATVPFARLLVDREAIKLTVIPLGSYVFPRERIESIRRVFLGVRIKHSIPEYPRVIAFHTSFDYRSLMETLRALGYQVHEPEIAKLLPRL